MNIAIGADHAGVALKDLIVAHLMARGCHVEDFGTHDTASVDYPDHGRPVALAVANGEVARGILVCGTGQGMCMTANKVPGVRAAVVSEPFSARMATLHNDARVLCLGSRVVGQSVAMECVDAWLDAEFEGGRHARRVAKMTGDH